MGVDRCASPVSPVRGEAIGIGGVDSAAAGLTPELTPGPPVSLRSRPCALWHCFSEDAEDSALVGRWEGGLVTEPADDQELACSWLGDGAHRPPAGGRRGHGCTRGSQLMEQGFFPCGLGMTKCSMDGVQCS